MKFIGANVGRCVKLFAWEEVRPVHGVSTRHLVTAICDRFKFQVKPDFPVAADTVIKFAEGSTVIEKTLIAIQKMDLYSDGYAIDCANTDDAKLVSDEVFKWAKEELGYGDFIREPKVIFLSQIVVEFDPDIGSLFGRWEKIQSLLNQAIQVRYKVDKSVEATRMQWRCDPHLVLNANLVSDFTIERKALEPYSSNRWFCSGPLPTQDLADLLASLEGLAK